MKVNLKLFAGLFALGTVAAVVPTVLTSCKSEAKEEDKNEAIHEKSITFTFDEYHDDTNNMKKFLNMTECVFDPKVTDFSVTEDNDIEDLADFLKSSNGTHNYLTSKSSRARNLLINENLPLFWLKCYLFRFIIYSPTYLYSEIPNGNLQSIIFEIRLSENSVVMHSTTNSWRGNEISTIDINLHATWAEDKFELVNLCEDYEYPIVDNSTNWGIEKGYCGFEDIYGIKFSGSDTLYPIIVGDWGSIKSFYEQEFPILEVPSST